MQTGTDTPKTLAEAFAMTRQRVIEMDAHGPEIPWEPKRMPPEVATGLQQNARDLGALFLDGLESLKDRHPMIGDVRGRGLFLGIELVRDRTTLEPASEEAEELVNRMRDRGVLLSTDGPLHNVIKIKPPLVIERSDVEMTLRLLDDVLESMGDG